MTFDSFGFDRRIRAGIEACGYQTPTPIQHQAIPEVLAGRDVLGLAQTGTGKTAAFALPILQRLLESVSEGEKLIPGHIRTLVLAPTRELALQIQDDFQDLGRETGIKSAVVIGGVNQNPQVKSLERATVCIACPGRFLDLYQQGLVDLRHVDTLVLDEADRMMDMGFMPDVRRILLRLPQKRQNLLFSATMPRDIRRLAENIMKDPAEVQVANTAPAASVSHEFFPVRQDLKTKLLLALLEETEYESILIFTRTKHRAKRLAASLSTRGHRAASLQGNMSQAQRQRALDGFRQGNYRVLVATDIAARGIDCERISHVINFDIPDTAETYAHRIGRTGRAGRTGSAFSLVTADDGRLLCEIEGIVPHEIARCTLETFDYAQPVMRREGAGEPRYGAVRGNGRGRSGERSEGGGRGRSSGKPRAEARPEAGGDEARDSTTRKQPRHESRTQQAQAGRGGEGQADAPKKRRRRRRKPKSQAASAVA